jgi:hypothetical protein
MGLPLYAAIDRKPENGCEGQNAACGRREIKLYNRLVTTAEVEARLTADLRTLSLDMEQQSCLDSFSPGHVREGSYVRIYILPASRHLRTWEVWASSSFALWRLLQEGAIWIFCLGVSYRVAGNGFRRVAKSTEFSAEVKIMAMTWVVCDRR